MRVNTRYINSTRGTPSPEFRSCVKVEVTVLGSPSLIVCMVSVDVKRATLNSNSSEFRSCVKVEVAVLGFPPL